MEPLMIALAFVVGFAVQLVRLPPLVGFLAAGFALNAMGFERSPMLDTIANLSAIAPQAALFELSARTGEGLDALIHWLDAKLA